MQNMNEMIGRKSVSGWVRTESLVALTQLPARNDLTVPLVVDVF